MYNSSLTYYQQALLRRSLIKNCFIISNNELMLHCVSEITILTIIVREQLKNCLTNNERQGCCYWHDSPEQSHVWRVHRFCQTQDEATSDKCSCNMHTHAYTGLLLVRQIYNSMQTITDSIVTFFIH